MKPKRIIGGSLLAIILLSLSIGSALGRELPWWHGLITLGMAVIISVVIGVACYLLVGGDE